jgi:hypothetical protein
MGYNWQDIGLAIEEVSSMGRRRYGSGYGGGRFSYRRRERRREERSVEMVSFGLIIVLFAVTLLYPNISPATVSFIGGGILTGAAVFQWQRRWRVNPMTWIGGIVLLIAGVLGLQGREVPYGMLLPLAIFGLVILASFVTGEF